MTPLMIDATMSGTMTILSAFMKSLPINLQKMMKSPLKDSLEFGSMSAPTSVSQIVSQLLPVLNR